MLLGLPDGPWDMHSNDEIAAAYRARMREAHPDAGGNGDPRLMVVLKAARDRLLR
jgi:hypothetical protein